MKKITNLGLTPAVSSSMACSSTHLSAILAHVGLASHHCPNIVIQAPIKCDKKKKGTHLG